MFFIIAFYSGQIQAPLDCWNPRIFEYNHGWSKNFDDVDGVYMKLNVGDVAPDFVLESHMEQKIRLSELSQRGKITVIAFFPKAWTPI